MKIVIPTLQSEQIFVLSLVAFNLALSALISWMVSSRRGASRRMAQEEVARIVQPAFQTLYNRDLKELVKAYRNLQKRVSHYA